MIEIIIYLAAILIFGLRSVLFCIGAYKERNRLLPTNDTRYFPFVSVVIPARNEEENIERCINSIFINTYPADKYEVIAVNDRSEDKTGEILNRLQQDYKTLKIISIDDESAHNNLKGKPRALQCGIEAAEGSVIMMTDADCVVNNKWIETMAQAYSNENVGLVASFTTIIGNKIFEKIQAVEWIYMHTMGSGGIGLNEPLGCYGNNLSVRKDEFIKLGGYEKIRFSVTEDLALLQAVYKSGRTVRYFPNYNMSVETLPCKNLLEYFNQRHRWAIGGLSLGWRGAVFVITSFALWVGIITSLITCQPLWLLAVVVSRILGDYAVITPSLNILKKYKLGFWVIPSVLFFIIAEAIVPFLLLNKEIVWKGQIFRKH